MMIKGLGSLSCEERLGELSLFSLKERKLRGELFTMFQYLKGGYKEDGMPFLQGVTWIRRGLTGTSYFWGDSDWAQEEHFSQ